MAEARVPNYIIELATGKLEGKHNRAGWERGSRTEKRDGRVRRFSVGQAARSFGGSLKYAVISDTEVAVEIGGEEATKAKATNTVDCVIVTQNRT